jgi:S-adenosylmethionine-diacylgycerolhomoserine-N-methlytransferase
MYISVNDTETTTEQTNAMRRYYQVHANIYAYTRWSFLFGRSRLLALLKIPLLSNQTILEVGCGTGHNLFKLAYQYLNLRLVGIDVSPEMLQKAAEATGKYARRVQLINASYGESTLNLDNQPNVILFSYCLTMINPGWDKAIERAWEDLPKGGRIAVVDFHRTRMPIFRRWMQHNHVRMDGHLLPNLKTRFETVQFEVRTAYFGLWTYFVFVGKK